MVRSSNKLESITHAMRSGKRCWIGRITLGTDINGRQVRESFSNSRRSDVVEKTREYMTRDTVSRPTDPQETILGPSLCHRALNVESKGVKTSTLSEYDHNLRPGILLYPYADIEARDITIQNFRKSVDSLALDGGWLEGAVDTAL